MASILKSKEISTMDQIFFKYLDFSIKFDQYIMMPESLQKYVLLSINMEVLGVD